jgi:GNAT superfamily N-acetyltransferase
MIIRRATAADTPAISAMKNFDCSGLVQSRLIEMATGRAEYLVMDDGGTAVGHVLLVFGGSLYHPEYPDIVDLRVLEARRGQGIGTQLVAACEDLARARGYTRIGLAVNPDLNARAQALYERLGYCVVDGRRYLDGVYDGVEDWVIDMVKDLR